jgi:CheY-like chemotaxis protein
VPRHQGATVTAVATVREALAVAAADIVVSAPAMPGGDGGWLLGHVNRRPHAIPVISENG